MQTSNIQILIVMGAYLLFSIAVGIWYVKKSNKGSAEYFLGGRSLGPWVAAMSAEASDMSGWLLMGLPGVAYFTGAGEAAWTAIGLAVGTWLNWRIVASRLRSYTQIAGNSITLPAFFSNRFRDKRHILIITAAVTILVFFSIYVGAQFVTFAKVFGYIFGDGNYYAILVVLGALFVLVYTLIGGFLAVCMTDFFQGLLMFVALMLVLAIGTFKAGGVAQIAENLRAIPSFTELFGIAVPVDAGGSAVSAAAGNAQAAVGGAPAFGPGMKYGFLSILSCLAWGVGYFGMPQVVVRFMAIRKSSELKRSTVIAVTWCVISLFAAVAIGMIGRALMPTLLGTASASETIFLRMAVQFLPPLLAGLVLSGILAASMSSCDSYMLIVSSALANDLVRGVLKRNASERAIMWLARVTLLLVTLFGIWVALAGSDTIFRVVSYAWAGLGAAFGPLMLFSLFWKRTTLPGAVAGMFTGGVMVVVWKNWIGPLGGYFGVYELLPAFVLSAIAIFAVSLLTKEPSDEIKKEFDLAKTSTF
jgi:sodium/proline symporter